MRSIIKMLGLAFMATLAFSVVGALGAGSASALLFLVSGGKASESFTVENLGKPTLETKGGNKVECSSVLGSGTILNKTDVVDKILFTFHKCSATFDPSCTSAGEPSGLIKTLELDGLLVTLLASQGGKYGIVLLPEKGTSTDFTEFSCSGLAPVTTVVTGSVVGQFAETKAESEASFKTAAKITFEKGVNAGEAKIKDYETLQGVKAAELKSTLTGSITETNVESNEQAEGDNKTTNGIELCHN